MKSTVTTKGQITIPIEIRNKFHLKSGDEIEFFILESGKIECIPVTTSIKELKGFLPKPKKRVSLEDMDIVIRERNKKI
jgi:antitoxin PrlF